MRKKRRKPTGPTLVWTKSRSGKTEGASFISTTAAADGKENATKAATVATKKGKKGTKKGPKKIKSKMEDARAAANKACATSVEALFESDGKLIPPPPAFYNVRLAKASRPGRLEEAVEAVLRKCSKAGEKVEEEVDDKGRPTVRLREFSISDSHSFLILPLFSCYYALQVKYYDPDEAAGLRGQKEVLERLGARLMENMAPLNEIGWVGLRRPQAHD